MIIRIPIYRLATGFHWFTLFHGKVKYINRETIEVCEGGALSVVREESRSLIFNEIRYSLVDGGGGMIAFVRGNWRRGSTFYVERIRRVAEDTGGMDVLRLLGDAVERDLRSRGCRYATLLTPVRLAPILMRKLEVHSVRGIPLEKLRRGWRRRIPWKMVLLRKY
jgi:hypothetical protein